MNPQPETTTEVLDSNREVIPAATSESAAQQGQNGRYTAAEGRESRDIDNLPQHVALVPAGLEVVPDSGKEPVPQPEKEVLQAEKEAISREEKEAVHSATQPDAGHTVWHGPKTSRKICGIRARILTAALILIMAVAVALGAGLGIGLHHGDSKREDPTSSSDGPSIIPTTLPINSVAATGTYALRLSPPTNVQAECLTNANNKQAWDCDLVGVPALAISVGVPAAPRPTTGAFFFYADSEPGFEYGAQYQYMNTGFATYQAVQDAGEENKGPALYFGQSYDKIVVLPESAFPVPSGTQTKRDYHIPAGTLKKRQIINPGDKTWMCVWNDTLIEGWIYVEQDITTSAPNATSSSSISTLTASPGPTETTVSTSISGSLAATSTGPLTQGANVSAASTAASSSQTGDEYRKRQLQKRQTTSSSPGSDDESLTPDEKEALDTYSSLPPYPYLIKIEERRVADGDTGSVPYCEQYQMLNSGELVPFVNGDFPNGVKFDLAERPPAYTAYDDNASTSATSSSSTEQASANPCHCEWWAQ